MPNVRSSRALPTPESCSSWGELMAPPQRITSLAVTLLAAAPAELRVLHARRPRPVEQDLVDHRARADLEVRAVHDRVQVGHGGAVATAVVDVAVERREALLLVAVDVLRQRVAGLCARLEERLEQRARRRAALEHERAVAAAPLVRAREARLHLLEVRQAVGVVPVLHALVARPALVVQRVAALEDHPVDRARPAEHLAARVVDAPPVHARLGLGLVLPVVEAVADRDRQRGRHVDEEVELPVGAARLQDEHLGGGVGTQAVGERAARRTPADDHEVVALISHGPDPMRMHRVGAMATGTSAPTRMFISGAWEDALSGATAEAAEPGDRRGARPGRPGRPRGRPPRDRRRQGRVPGLGARDRVRPRRGPAPRRRRLRAPPRRARPRADPRPGQAAARRGLRRGRRARRDVARRGRGRHPPRGRDRAEHEPGQSRPARPPPARPGRGRHAVELAVHDARRDRRPGARVRQHRRVDAGAEHRGLLGPARRVRRRGRPAARRLQLRHRPRPGGRRRAGRPPGHRRGRLHRLDRDRPAHRAPRGGQGAAARDGRQRPARRDGRRRRRGGRRGRDHGLLPVRRAELHRGRAAARPRGGPRRLRRARWPSASRATSSSATRSPRAPRSAR